MHWCFETHVSWWSKSVVLIAFVQQRRIFKGLRNFKPLNIFQLLKNILVHSMPHSFICGGAGAHVWSHTTGALASIHKTAYTCTFCGPTFSTSIMLNHYVQSHTSQAERSRYARGNLYDTHCILKVTIFRKLQKAHIMWIYILFLYHNKKYCHSQELMVLHG